MAILALHLWPDASRELLVACIVHDLGESATGDIPWPAKEASTVLRGEISAMEAEALAYMGMPLGISGPINQARLKYLDRLDAYLWAVHHKPKLRKRKKWRKAKAWLDDQAKELL